MKTKIITRAALAFVASLFLAGQLAAGEGKIRKRPHPVKDEYIVVLKDDITHERVPDVARGLSQRYGGDLQKTWRDAIKGFFVVMTPGRAQALSHDPDVAYVEENAEMFLSGTTVQTRVSPDTCDANGQNCTAATDNRLWHLDRLSQTWASGDGLNTSCLDGTGVTVYVLDTGVMGLHDEFKRANGTSRVEHGYDAANEYSDGGVDYFPANNPCNGFAGDRLPSQNDSRENKNYKFEVGYNGHGTSVAAVVAGRVSGVAKNATIVPIKTAPCEGNAARRVERNTFYAKGTMMFAAPSSWVGDFVATTSGTTGPTHPQWPSSGTVTDGGVVWLKRSGSASLSTVQMMIDGLDWIKRQNTYSKQPAVVTTSRYQVATIDGVDEPPGGPTPLLQDTSLEDTVRNLVASGITLVASANNQGEDACLTSPARLSRTNPDVSLRSKVITVGGSMIVNNPFRIDPLEVPVAEQADGVIHDLEPDYDETQPTRDARWICGDGDASLCTTNGDQDGSNAGACVTLFAPAKNMSVASNVGTNTYRDSRRAQDIGASGTSFSAPFVAGVIARMLQANNLLSVDDVHTQLMNNHVLTGVLRDDATYPLNPPNITGTPNKLIHFADVSVSAQPADKFSSSSSPAALSVSATGVGTLSFQWFQVASGYDLTHRRGAFIQNGTVTGPSTPISGATSATLSNLNPSTRTGYWVRVTSGCAQAESDIAVVTPLAAPASLAADSAGGGVINLSWSAVADATSYVIERKVGTGAWLTLPGTVSSPSFSDTGVAASSVALYRVRSRNGTVDSAPSNVDFGHTWSLTDPNITQNVTTIKALHITELRAVLNQVADAAALSRRYTNAEALQSALQGVIVDDSDFSGLLNNINSVRTDPVFGLGSSGFGQTPLPNTFIRKTQIDDLRTALR